MQPNSNYFFRQPAAKWSMAEALSDYGQKHPNVTLSKLYGLMLQDLKVVEGKRTVKTAVQPMINDIKTIQDMISTRGSQTTNIQAPKVADNWTSNGDVSIVQTGESSKERKRTNEDTAILSMKKAKKSYQIVPAIAPSVSLNKPRLDDDDYKILTKLVQIQINDKKNPLVKNEVYQEYSRHMNDQAVNSCLKSMPQSQKFLQDAMNQDLSGLPSWLWAQNVDGGDEEKKLVKVMQLTLTDFYANCCRPEPVAPLNERTPFVDHLIPVVKYYNASYQQLHMQWGEKGFQSNKFIAICLTGGDQFPKKLVDSIGISVGDRSERLIVESSGEEDDGHSTEDTLKIIECSIQCLKMDMANHKLASFDTFKKRRFLGLQYIGNKISLVSIGLLNEKEWYCVLERSAVIPRSWHERRYWIKVFELLIRMNELLQEQTTLSDKLIDEDTSGTITQERTIKYVYSDLE